ncbi:Response regulator protein VraR [Lacunisphaera limnophila]|uniref:Response regulator protein VraR n=1 Tax=Lacunisphaera limnophila TaxID=1838286 RepID=A0A1D8AT39_9BACT|nr:response regulator transcription factor [Lacunisphaera limnophila]AOS44032.1 Response regulator protein VraR [Lacunisphaera limnophila]
MGLKVIVVDDHPLFRAGVVAALKTEENLEVCGEADTAIAARELATRLQPDAAVVDLLLQDDDGLKLVRELRQMDPRLKIVVLSMLDPGVYAPKALQAGASFFVSKQEGPAAIISALRRAVANERASTPAGATDPRRDLSERELQVFLQLGLGRSTQEISTALGVSVKTIESHREAIKAKLDLPHANALVARAALWTREQGLAR